MEALTKKDKRQSAFAYGCLIFVIILWGITPVINREIVYDYYSPTVYTMLCGIISAVALFLISIKNLNKMTPALLRVAIPTGLINAAATILQKIGLQYTTPSKCAFLDTLSCIMVPLMLFILTRKRPSVFKVAGAGLCLAGCFILTECNFLEGTAFGIGELLCALAGLLYGANTAITSVFAQKSYVPLHVMIHMGVQFITSAIMTLILGNISISGKILEPIRFDTSPIPILIVFTSALIATTLGWVIRINVLKKIDATVVGVMMPLSAVVTGFVSVSIGADELSYTLVIGGLLGVGASIISSLGGKTHSNPRMHKKPPVTQK